MKFSETILILSNDLYDQIFFSTISFNKKTEALERYLKMCIEGDPTEINTYLSRHHMYLNQLIAYEKQISPNYEDKDIDNKNNKNKKRKRNS